ncbi:M23 family metallopeptidase [Xanthomarina sp. F1114]|uniref:M23 family metallopeptidase n=1 Tax=Xanthomarina sp. F1114 TaxID=2996019 RepID=UPI00225E1DC4|nr:M23 family metallopeptidase [Xanthomarina sp. F1114]MCX7547050.1 M23 family metallopeptidase [Xanthomarina sp. F1114]
MLNNRGQLLFLLVLTLFFSCNKDDENSGKTQSDIFVALPTSPVKLINTDGTWLVYEMHIIAPKMDRVNVFYNDTQLLSYTQFITKGNAHIASIWLEYPEAGWDKELLRHNFEYRDAANNQKSYVYNLKIDQQYPDPATVAFPVPQGVWLAEGAPSASSYHTRAIFPYSEPVFDYEQQGYLIGNNPQRYAIDYAMLVNGLPYINDGKNLTDWYCYNLPVLAAKGGKVIFTENSIPDNTTPFELDYPTDITNANGNVVFVEHTDGTIGTYCHLVPNSIVVEVGDIVTTGQELGRLGNSGNSFAPHLHMHVLLNPEGKTLESYEDGFFMESSPYKFAQFAKLGDVAPGFLDQTPIVPFTSNTSEVYSDMLPSESDVIEL